MTHAARGVLRFGLSLLPLLVIAVGCAQPASPGGQANQTTTTEAHTPKRLAASIFPIRWVCTRSSPTVSVGSVSGLDALQQFMHAGRQEAFSTRRPLERLTVE